MQTNPARIVLINHYAGSPSHGMEFRPFYLAREWAARGHAVTVVAASHSHLRLRQPATPRWVTSEKIGALEYLWVRTPKYRGSGAGRIANMLAFVSTLLTLSPWLARKLRPSLVVASSTYPLDIFPAFSLARLSGAKLAFEVHDLWPLSPMEIGKMSRWHPAIVVMRLAELFAYRASDSVVSMLPCALDYMKAQGMQPEKYIHVPNGIDVDEWEKEQDAAPPTEHVATIERERRAGKFVVGYTGAHGPANALDLLVGAAERLRDAPVHFVLVGQGPAKAKLQADASAAGLANMTFLPSVPKTQVPGLLAAPDALFIGSDQHSLYRFGVSPNKLFDYMMAGKPIVNALAAPNDPVGEAGGGVTVAPGSPAAIADGIRRLMACGKNELATMGERSRAYVRSKHDYRVLADEFLRFCNR